MFLEISQNSQENTCEFCEISKNTFSYRATPVAASVLFRLKKQTRKNVADTTFKQGISAWELMCLYEVWQNSVFDQRGNFMK